MSEKINQILQELYRIDPQLKNLEKEERLKKIIQELLENRPQITQREDFYQELRQLIIQKTQQLEPSSSQNSSSRFWNWKVVAGISLSLATIVLLVIIFQMKHLDPTSPNSSKQTASSRTEGKFKTVEDQAFGKLSRSESREPESSQEIMGRGAGGPTPQFDAPQGRTMIAPPPAQVRYQYSKELPSEILTLLEGNKELPVYQREKGFPPEEAEQLARELELDLLNLDSFSDTKIANLSLSQEKKFGLTFNINFQEGAINAYQNWQFWDDPRRNCQDTRCYERYQLKAEDKLSDQKIIEISDSFLEEHQVSLDNYTNPMVENNRAPYPTTQAEVFIPDQVSVIYPLQIKDQTVYNSQGDPEGLRVQVDIRHQKVAGLHNLNNQSYLVSSYSLETNPKKLIEAAEEGGIQQRFQVLPMPTPLESPTVSSEGSSKEISSSVPAPPHSQPEETILKLGNPSLIYAKHYQPTKNTTETQELLVPMLAFPVQQSSTSNAFFYHSSDQILVPLVEDLLEDLEGNYR